jgi:hypothetical protein
MRSLRHDMFLTLIHRGINPRNLVDSSLLPLPLHMAQAQTIRERVTRVIVRGFGGGDGVSCAADEGFQNGEVYGDDAYELVGMSAI